ncbi:hypothetical protein ACMDB5_13055 [Flavobacterium sp. W1B]|uniref:hypothetical protein n=1 Tax=Flavobacterium sp. W1B TaxID=3394146 RepID=UPI0039BD3C48
MNKFLNLITGTPDYPTWLAGLFFAIIGLAFYYYSKVRKRNAESTATPYQFSFRFFLRDNLSELIFSILAIMLLMRFSVEHLTPEATILLALGFGLTGPKVIDMIMKYQAGARK